MGRQGTYIAQLGHLAVLVAIIEVAGLTRGANSVGLTDNVAALITLVNDSSGSYSMEQMAEITHLACFALRSVSTSGIPV